MTAADADPARADVLASARCWSVAALSAGGFSGMLVPVLDCLMLVTMGVAVDRPHEPLRVVRRGYMRAVLRNSAVR